jgi:hypothetical protein
MRRVLSLALAFAFLAAAAPSSANDTKHYGGVNCKAAGSPNSFSFVSGWFTNLTTGGEIRAICPVVRDEVNGSSGPQATMRVHDPSSAAAVSCDFVAASSGGAIVHATFDDTTVNQTGDVNLSFSALTSGSLNRDYYYLSCLIPQNTRIYSYRVTEEEQTD